jgi:NAD(P)H-dependent flavin oxidoreductase YrpB (nitropropane dioxygenase family)
LIEGGKGVAATNHMSSGAWAAAGGIGTISAVNADSYDPAGKIIPQVFAGMTRRERHDELIAYGIRGAVAQIERAYEMANGKGAININVLWEMGGSQPILHGILEQVGDKVTGVTCGAGMPYKLSEIAAKYGVYYLPIVSSGRAFRALWKRAYSKVPEWLGAVVYEDPWLAGGHNGLSNAEDPLKPEDPYPRVKALRDVMRAEGISDDVPIVMAGGVWCLREWNDWIDNPELGQIAFQFGTRPLLTQERMRCAPSNRAMSCCTNSLPPVSILRRSRRRFSCGFRRAASGRLRSVRGSRLRLRSGWKRIARNIG